MFTFWLHFAVRRHLLIGVVVERTNKEEKEVSGGRN